MLIAIGLTTVVMVAVPILLYSVDIMLAGSRYEDANHFAQTVHSLVADVDSGNSTSASVEVVVPRDITVSADATHLSIKYLPEGEEATIWTETYNHTILLTPPTTMGTYLLTIDIKNDLLVITFESLLKS